ncbi:MAG: tRNA-dihydrouridine synthase family protein [Planctomycetota bacterium]
MSPSPPKPDAPPARPEALAWIDDRPYYQAGLAGYSDAAMRLVARRHGCPYCITEAMLDVFLVNGGKGLADAELTDDDHSIAGQLMGSHPVDIAAGAKVLLGLGYDVIDVNLACPVKKVKRKARGGHLLSEPDQAIAILDAVREAVGDDAPCTVKLRRAYDDSPEMAAAFDRVFEAAIELGYCGATVHSRTVEQKYIGPGHRPFLRTLTDRYGNETVRADRWAGCKFTIGGSGDVWGARDVQRMLEQTGVDVVSIARGCIGNPWVFEQCAALLVGNEASASRPPTIHQQRDVLLEHFELSVGLHGDGKAGRMMRKFGIKFSRHHPDGHAVKDAFITVKSLDDWRGVLGRWYAVDGPGVVAPLSKEEAEAEEVNCGEPIGVAG